jgi:hypothetical protein
MLASKEAGIFYELQEGESAAQGGLFILVR